jgi:chromate transporter
VVGVIASLALWFAAHVWFAEVPERGLPDPSSIQWLPAALTLIAILLTFVLRAPLGVTLLISAALGAATLLLPA